VFQAAFEAEREAMYEAGLLTAVRYGYFEGIVAPLAVVLDFEAGSWVLTVDPDDDTVLVDASAGLPSDLRFEPAPGESPWTTAIGAQAQWIWIMYNQRGYEDGLQFGFGFGSAEVCQIQLMAMASTWRVYELRRVV
jgi:hypothetical protein